MLFIAIVLTILIGGKILKKMNENTIGTRAAYGKRAVFVYGITFAIICTFLGLA